MRILDRPAVLMEKAVNTDPNGSVLADASAFFKLEPSGTYHMGCTNDSVKPR